jgi:ubiquinone/menaquinone biosynthesis C-methylase UbiE
MNPLRMLVPVPLRPAARRVRSLFRTLVPVAHTAPLAGDCRAAVRVVRNIPPVEAGRTFGVKLAITNHTPAAVSPLGSHPVGVGVSWRSFTGEPCGIRDGFVPLPRPLWPGEELAHEFAFTAPESLGDYVAAFAVTQEHGPRFGAVGRSARLDVAVTHPRDDGFNYHDIYAAADLKQDFWTASGPHSKAEFDRLVPIKLKLLKDVGLAPDSRLLDVGCGTGLLATAAEGFLSDHGLYYGTDLAKKAIDFCKGRYRRPNFHFLVSGMTTVPVTGVEFDVVSFFSVFTHTYPDETALLLAEVTRLLAPNGVIFADVFTSPLVQREAGSRYAVEANRDHLLRLIGLVGLKAEVVMTHPWNGQARREFFKLTRRG